MNINTGRIYDSYEKAIEAGEIDKNLVTGTRETLEELKRSLKLRSKYEPHQSIRERKRRRKIAKEHSLMSKCGQLISVPY